MNKTRALLHVSAAAVLTGIPEAIKAAPPVTTITPSPKPAPSPAIKAKRPPVPAKSPKFNPNMNALKTTQMRKAMGRRS